MRPDIGGWFASIIDWMLANFGWFFDGVAWLVSQIVGGVEYLLIGLHPFLVIALLAGAA